MTEGFVVLVLLSVHQLFPWVPCRKLTFLQDDYQAQPQAVISPTNPCNLSVKIFGGNRKIFIKCGNIWHFSNAMFHFLLFFLWFGYENAKKNVVLKWYLPLILPKNYQKSRKLLKLLMVPMKNFFQGSALYLHFLTQGIIWLILKKLQLKLRNLP